MSVGRYHNNPPQDQRIGAGNPRRVKVQLGSKFVPLLTSSVRHIALYGGRGTAKSHSVGTALPIRMASDHKRVVCARQYQNSIRDSVKELLELKIHELGLQRQFKFYEREIVHIKQESRATFIGLDRNPDSAKSLEGADICWIEEARTLNRRSFEIIIPTIRKPGSQLIWTWNPEFHDDPVDEYFRGTGLDNFTPPPNSYIQQVTIADNPFFYQTAMPQEMWHMMTGNYARYQHIWLGGYDETFETKVFSNIAFDRPDITGLIPRYGMDFGFGVDPSAIVKIYVNHIEKWVYIAKEFIGCVPLRQLPAAIMTVVENQSDLITADPASAVSIEHLNSQGFNLVGAVKGPGSVKSGINWLQSYKIYIDPDCEGMRDEARLYSWMVDKRTGKILPEPVDANNHGWDATRYATEVERNKTGKPDTTGGVIKLNLRRG